MFVTMSAPRGLAEAACLLLGCTIAGSLVPSSARAQETAGRPSSLSITGDLRLRYEDDWDSHTASGVERTDRTRGRLRARVNFAYGFDPAWTAGVRIRTGNTHSQQSPHLTFASDDGVRDDLEFVVDRYFVQYRKEELTVWAGRNAWPFWQQNEFFWDEDVTPTGAAGSYETAVGQGKLTSVLGAFTLPDGGYGLNGALYGGQIRYNAPVQKGQVTVAGAFHRLGGSMGADNLRNRNGERDYLLGVLSAQWTSPVAGRQLALGVDYFHNFENYDAADTAPFPVTYADETDGYVLSALYGQLKKPHDWQLGYYYAHIEEFAVDASYSQDDWVRWGSGTQTDGSDAKGHELRASYLVTKSINLVARLFIVDAITSVQDGKRFRLDANWRF